MIHIAAPVRDDIQYCANCDFILKDLRRLAIGEKPLGYDGGSAYPDGSLVECGPGWQAMLIHSSKEKVTCVKE